MAYVLEKINSNDRDRILSDASCDEEKIGRLMSRNSGFFRVNKNLTWSIDRENDSYLVFAPSRNYESISYNYFYYYSGKMYNILLKRPMDKVVYITEDVDIELLSVIKNKVQEAFLVYGRAGLGKDESLTCVVELEGLK